MFTKCSSILNAFLIAQFCLENSFFLELNNNKNKKIK